MEPIAYVGNDGQLYVLDTPDARPRCLTADDRTAGFSWPTWAPDGTRLAVMRQPRGTRRPTASVEVYSVQGHPPHEVWRAANGGPICLAWAPDGRRLGLLVQEADALHLLVATVPDAHPGRADAPRGPAGAVPLVTGAPLYWCWAPDGQALVFHVGGHYQGSRPARVVLARPDLPSDTWQTLSTEPLAFRAPAWEPTGARIAYAAHTPRGPQLVVYDARDGHTEPVASVGDAPAFLWAPAGERLIVGTDRGETGLYEGLTLLDLASGDERRLGRLALAFWWLPGGEALLCVGPDASGEGLAWERVDPTTNQATTLARFSPTAEIGLLLGHFDQYAPAVQLYSATEDALLFASAGDETRHNGHSAEHADLWLALGAGPVQLRRLAGGTHGFFAPTPGP